MVGRHQTAPVAVHQTNVSRTIRRGTPKLRLERRNLSHNQSFILSTLENVKRTMKIGYARVSTQDQNLDRQLDQLRREGCERIYEEKESGAKSDRPELMRMLDALREGDVVVVAELSRLSRSVRDLFGIVGRIDGVGAQIRSLKEPWLDTTTPHGRLLFTFFSGISEFERELIRQRTLEGLTAARARGRNGGHPTLNKSVIERSLKMYDSKQFAIKEITETTGISKSALYSYIRARKRNVKDS